MRRLLLLIVLLAPAQSLAAIAEVGSGTQRACKSAANVDSTTQAFPGNVTAGNLLVVVGNNFHTGGSTVAISDSLGTSYTVMESNPYTDHASYIAYGIAPSSGANTVTINPTTTGNYIGVCQDEFSGVDTGSPLDVNGGVSTGTSTTAADSITTGTANALIIGVMGHRDPAGVVALTPGGSYTEIGEQQDASNQEAYNAVFRIATTAQAYTVDWTIGSSQPWFVRTASFKEATASAVASGLSLMGVGK